MTNKHGWVRRVWSAGAGIASLAALTACASDVNVLRSDSNASKGKDTSTGGQQSDASPAGSKATGTSGSGSGTAPNGSAPMDLYLMFDQSSSMNDRVANSPADQNGTWWSLATDGIRAFARDPSAIGTGVAIQYFPLGGIAPASCSAPYGTPEVGIAPLPSNAPELSASLVMHSPMAFTPTGPALRGALEHMKAWAPAHPDRVPAVVLITDGFPTECEPQTIEDIASIAASAYGTEPSVKTFVIGLNLGAGVTNLDAIASAGGTGDAFAIDAFVTPMLRYALNHVIGHSDGG